MIQDILKIRLSTALLISSFFLLVFIIINRILVYSGGGITAITTYFNLSMIILGVIFIFSAIAESAYNDKKKLVEKVAFEKLQKDKILSDFENGRPIFIRVTRGFINIPFVISKENKWEFTDRKFILDNEFFSIEDVLYHQAK